MGRHQLVQCQLYTIVRSKVTARITTDPLISVQYFWSLIFLIFKLSESFWNRFKTTFLTQEMNLKKISSKIFNFLWSKNILKKNVVFFRKKNYRFQTSGKSPKKIQHIFQFFDLEKFQKKSLIFFKINFRPQKNNIFRWDFF